MAILRFHQPENLVLLCANCHTLLDDPAVAEVDQGLMFYLRDRATATGHFGEVTRAFVCKEMTGNRRRPSVSDAALAPLFDWLQKAVERGALPEPHRFTARGGGARARDPARYRPIPWRPCGRRAAKAAQPAHS